MPGVVIIHAIEDAAPAHALAAKLRAEGHEVRADLAPGREMRGVLMDCDAAIALWSPRSIVHDGLVEEAGLVRRLGRLIHARMHNTPPPGEFARDPAIDLTGWRGEETFPGWLNLRAAVEGVVAAVYGEPAGPIDFGEVVETAPRRLSEREHRERELAQREEERLQREEEAAQRAYERQFRPPPAYRARAPQPEGGGASPLRLAAIGLVTFAVVAGVGIGAYSMIQGGRSAADLESAWAQLDKTNPLAVRAFLDNEPGRYRGPAETTLEELEIEALGQARATDTVEAYQRFLTNFPQTTHSAEIRGRLAMIRRRDRDLALAPPELPKPGEDANAVGGPAEETPAAPTLDDEDDNLSGGGPVLLAPPPASAPPEEPISTEEQLRRQISGEDRSLGDDELKLQIQGQN